MLELLHPAVDPTIELFLPARRSFAGLSVKFCSASRACIRTKAPRLGGPWGGVRPWEALERRGSMCCCIRGFYALGRVGWAARWATRRGESLGDARGAICCWPPADGLPNGGHCAAVRSCVVATAPISVTRESVRISEMLAAGLGLRSSRATASVVTPHKGRSPSAQASSHSSSGGANARPPVSASR